MSIKRPQNLVFSPEPRKVLQGRVASEPDAELIERGRATVRAIARQVKAVQPRPKS